MATAPEMYQFLDYYDNGLGPVQRLDKPSSILLRKLFDAAEPICADANGHKKKFYFYLPKGTFEEYKSIHDEDEAKLREWFYHESDGWFECTLIKDKFDWENDYWYGVYINHAFVLALNDKNAVEWPETDATEFLHVLIDIVNDVVAKLKAGTYNNWVRENLAYYMKTGKVSRGDYWVAFPEEKKKYALSSHEREILMHEHANTFVPKTAREFYEAVAVCYRGIDLEASAGSLFTDSDEEHVRYGGVTPKELYYRYADGRDDGLANVPLDSKEEFQKWLFHKEPYSSWGGHPFEIIFSFTGKQSVHLYLLDDRLFLSGGCFPVNMTALKMYVALIDHGYDVEFGNREAILARVNETDYIGLKPWFQYHSFDDDPDDIIDVIELDYNSYEKLKDKIIWQSIPEVFLVTEKASG